MLAYVWRLQKLDFMDHVKVSRTYYDLVEQFKKHPGNRAFIARNVAAVILNAVHHCRHREAMLAFTPGITEILTDYLEDPDAILGPGPVDLGNIVDGREFTTDDFEETRAQFNDLCRNTTVTYRATTVSLKPLTAPRVQSMWCKLSGVLHDYTHGTLGLHARVSHSIVPGLVVDAEGGSDEL